MLKRIVPTPEKLAISTGGFAVGAIADTSRAGSADGTALFQLRPGWAAQGGAVERAARPTSGAATPWKFMLGAGRPPGYVTPPTVHGGALAPPSHTRPGLTDVVRLPDWKIAAYTVPPSGLAASARGVSPKSTTRVSGAP